MRSILALLARRRQYEGPGQGGLQGRPTGPEGWSRSRPSRRYVPAPVPPTPAPAGPTGPASLYGDLPRAVWLGSAWDPVLPTRCTHLVPPTVPYPARTPTRRPPTVRTVEWSNTHFGPAVGEPRGSRTHWYNRPQRVPRPVIHCLTGLHGRLTAISTRFINVLLNLVPVLLNLVTVLLNLVTVLLNY